MGLAGEKGEGKRTGPRRERDPSGEEGYITAPRHWPITDPHSSYMTPQKQGCVPVILTPPVLPLPQILGS